MGIPSMSGLVTFWVLTAVVWKLSSAGNWGRTVHRITSHSERQ